MPESAMPVPSRVLIPDVLPVVMPQLPAVPEFVPAAPAGLALPSRVPADLPAAGREALAAALAGPVPGAQRKAPGTPVLPGDDSPLAWDDAEMRRFLGFLRSMSDRRDPRGRRLPLDYLTAVAVAAGAAGDDSPEGAAEWAASAPARVLHRLGAPHDAAGRPRRPDAATFSRVLGDPRHAQQADDALCAWTGARARDLRPGMRRHLRIDGKALRGAARGGHAPMLLSGLWDDGTTAAQLPVNTKKENEIPVFRDLLGKIPPGDLKDAVISADQMHTQRKHAEKIEAAGAYFLFTIGDNQQKLFDAADALPWRAFAGEAWTVDRGHGRIDARTIKTLPPTEQILEKWPQVRQVFLVERYSYGTGGEVLGAVAVLGITSLPPGQADAADLLAYLRGHWAIEMHHYVRDIAFGEDGHRAAAAHQASAAIRNAVTGAFRLLRVPGIAAQLRASRRDPYRLPLQLLGLAELPPSPA
ncbi:MAG: ISAs1 family transposase [Streptosporangiaceae bacterium]